MEASTPPSKRGMMPPMLRPRLVPVIAALAVIALLAATAAAPGKKKPAAPKRYHFALVEVKAGDGVDLAKAPDLPAAIKAQAEKVLAAHPQLVATLTDPPAQDAGFPVWQKYLAKQKLDGAYRVNIEI